jgi:fumarylacetoacetase
MRGVTATWVDIPDGSPFPLANLPYGVVVPAGSDRCVVVVRIGDRVVDLARLAEAGLLPDRDWWATGSLNAFMADGPEQWRRVRERLVELLSDDRFADQVGPALLSLADVAPVLPFAVADYVDFYASEQHATNLGRILRPGQDPLLPNWRHLPVGYHGRSGTVVVSGTPVRRPTGQRIAPGDDAPTVGPSLRLDIEAEVGFVVGTPSTHGEPVAAAQFAEHIFGVCLVNDWSARDIQAYEYQPLGPFLGKSFATSVSPWVVPLEALAAARLPVASARSSLATYLVEMEPWGLDISLEVRLNGATIAQPPFADMHWSPAQMVAHTTINGASLRTGDLFASGTVSGESPDQWGSLIELTWNGEQPLTLPDGSTRAFLDDGDEVVITATAPGPDGRPIGLGEVAGQVLPAPD